MRALESQGIEIARLAAGDEWAVGPARVSVRWPPAGQDEANPGLSLNDRSLVAAVRVETGAGERSVLLTGDIQRDAIVRLLDDPALSADVVEAPHHGAWTPAAMTLMERLGASVVIQSTGPSRADTPGWAPIRTGARWHTTATDGAAWAEVRRDGEVRSGTHR